MLQLLQLQTVFVIVPVKNMTIQFKKLLLMGILLEKIFCFSTSTLFCLLDFSFRYIPERDLLAPYFQPGQLSITFGKVSPTESDFITKFMKGLACHKKQFNPVKKAYPISYTELMQLFYSVCQGRKFTDLSFIKQQFICMLILSFSSFTRFEKNSVPTRRSTSHGRSGF